MKIEIAYEASWRNSFLDGNNDEPLPKKGRKFIGSSTALKNKSNYIKRTITHNTIMGILNRLIGEQKKLYQARQDDNYFFKKLEGNISFEDKVTNTNEEVVYLRNMSGFTDQNSFSGMVKTQDPIFNSSYSRLFWSVLALDIDELIDFINFDKEFDKKIEPSPIVVMDRFAEISKLKPITKNDILQKAIKRLQKEFGDINYENTKGDIVPQYLYCSALYLQLKRLSQEYSFESALTNTGTIPGISKRNFTKKDFMSKYATGGKKIVYGNPYMKKEKIKGEGEATSMLQKASGILKITIDIPREKAKELKRMIDNAGVSSFYLGKKGLAYVTNIDTREER